MAGTLSIWGHGSFKHEFMADLVWAWFREFKQHHADVELDYRMYGTASAIGALFTGAGNLAILGEEISPASRRAFIRARGYEPTGIDIATGSLDTNYFDYAHMIFVHADNPLPGMSLTQLAAVFGASGSPLRPDIRTWDQLGVGGEWARERIQPYGWRTDVDFALFFSERVLGGSHRWNTDIREYDHGLRGGRQYDHGQRILDALARDRRGIAISNIRYARPEVKMVPLSWDTEPYVTPSAYTLMTQEYPLTRLIPAVVDRVPSLPLEPLVAQFLRFILSRDGQLALLEHSGYLPLGPDARRAQLQKLTAA